MVNKYEYKLVLHCSAVINLLSYLCILGHLLVQFCILLLCPVDTFAFLLCYILFL